MARRMRNAARMASLTAIAAALLGLCVSPTVAAGATRAQECASTGCAWWKRETAAELPNEVTVEGGAEASGAEVPAPPALVKNFRIDSSPTPFGIEELSSEAERDDGSTDRQAGEHPFALTTTLNFNSDLEAVSNGSEPVTPTTTKDVQVELPPGLIGNPVPFEGQQCSEFDLLHPPPLSITNECPDNSAVGVATLTINEPTFGYFTGTVPVFNLQHGPGEPARLGFALLHAAVVLPTH